MQTNAHASGKIQIEWTIFPHDMTICGWSGFTLATCGVCGSLLATGNFYLTLFRKLFLWSVRGIFTCSQIKKCTNGSWIGKTLYLAVVQAFLVQKVRKFRRLWAQDRFPVAHFGDGAVCFIAISRRSRWAAEGFQLQALRQRALEEVPVPSHDELADGFPAFRHCGQCSESVAVQSATEQAWSSLANPGCQLCGICRASKTSSRLGLCERRMVGWGASHLSQTSVPPSAWACVGTSWGVGQLAHDGVFLHGGKKKALRGRLAPRRQVWWQRDVAWLRLHPGELWWNIRRSWRPSSTSARSSGPVHPLVQPFVMELMLTMVLSLWMLEASHIFGRPWVDVLNAEHSKRGVWSVKGIFTWSQIKRCI